MTNSRTPQVAWLLQKGGTEEAVPASERLAFDDEHWRATIERVDIGDDLRIFLTRAEIRRKFSIEPQESAPGVWLSSKIAVKGRVAISLSDGPRIQLSPDRGMLCRPSDGKARFTPQPRQSLRLAGYMLRDERVERLCDGAVPPAIRPLIAPSVERSLLVETPTTPGMRRLAAGMFSDRFTGPLRPIHLEGIALQLFADQSAAIATGPQHRRWQGSTQEIAAVHEARERLLADMSNPPTVGALAVAVGMSERALNAGFKTLFGATVFETLRNERLEHARIVLDGEDLPLKIMAARVGYRHVSNFISAFTARYGAPPRQFTGGNGD